MTNNVYFLPVAGFQSVKKWARGTSDFSWGLVTFQGYSSLRPVENLA